MPIVRSASPIQMAANRQPHTRIAVAYSTRRRAVRIESPRGVEQPVLAIPWQSQTPSDSSSSALVTSHQDAEKNMRTESKMPTVRVSVLRCHPEQFAELKQMMAESLAVLE